MSEKSYKPTHLSEEQLRWFVTHFSGVPIRFSITSESIPVVTRQNKNGDDIICRYAPGEGIDDIDDYIHYHSDDVIGLLYNDEHLDISRRMIIYMVTNSLPWYENERFEVPGRDGVTIDIQEYGPFGMDIWSARFDDVYEYYIAPVALLSTSTWDTYGMNIDKNGERHGKIPDSCYGKGREAVAEVWKWMGGEETMMDSEAESACSPTLESWKLSTESLHWFNDKARETLLYARDILGEEEYKKLRAEWKKNRHKALWYYEDDEDEDEEEDEEEEDEGLVAEENDMNGEGDET